MCLLITNTGSFVLQHYVDNNKLALTNNFAIFNELDICSVSTDRLTKLCDPDGANAGVVCKFIEEFNLDQIVKFVLLRQKTYSITTFKARK